MRGPRQPALVLGTSLPETGKGVPRPERSHTPGVREGNRHPEKALPLSSALPTRLSWQGHCNNKNDNKLSVHQEGRS